MPDSHSRPLIETLRQIWERRIFFVGNRNASRTMRRLTRLEERMDEHHREMRLLLTQLSLPDPAVFARLAHAEGSQPVRDVFPFSSVCRQVSFEHPSFAYWTRRMGGHPRYHRKQWELVYIVQALWERDVLKPGARGLGFGVGQEPLSALFASLDCEIMATDMVSEQAQEAGWIRSQEHAAGKESLRHPEICDETRFTRNVSFQVCDMNAIPDDLRGFDFCWSACAYEHLGSIEAGLRFVENSLATLKPGGWAVHTTELNVSSNEDTIDNEATVLFRRRDFEAFAEHLRAQGHFVAPFDFAPGDQPMDRFIDTPPYRAEPHLVLALQGYATTSFGLIVRKAG